MLAALAWKHRWVADDAFIDFRVVANLHHGLGPVWNAGERVEVFTSPLWVAVLWLVSSLLSFVALEWIAVGLGFLATVGGLGLAARGSWLLWSSRGRGRVGLPLGLAVVVAVRPMWDFATSGLETGLTFLWLGGCFWALARLNTAPVRSSSSAGRRHFWPSTTPRFVAVAIGLGVLVRPDLAIFSIGFFVALLAGQQFDRRMAWLRLIAWALLIPVAYQIFRMGYFAAVEPNTALAKEAGSADWSRGWAYLKDFVDPYWLVVPLALLLAYAALELRGGGRLGRPWLVLALAPAACGVVHALYIVRVGGDFMHGRMLLPSLLGLMLPVAVVVPHVHFSWRLVVGLAVVPWVVVCVTWLRAPYANNPAAGRVADERAFYVHLAHDANPITLGDYRRSSWARDGWVLKRLAERGRALVVQVAANGTPPVHVNGVPGISVPAPVVAGTVSVGLMGYAAGPEVHLIDQFGLGDPLAARTMIGPLNLPPGTIAPAPVYDHYLTAPARNRAGHEKFLPPEWTIARFAPQSVSAYSAVPASSRGVIAARRALACKPLQRLIGAVTGPLTVDRFLSNVGDSFSLTSLRFPAAPIAAERKLCG